MGTVQLDLEKAKTIPNSVDCGSVGSTYSELDCGGKADDTRETE